MDCRTGEILNVNADAARRMMQEEYDRANGGGTGEAGHLTPIAKEDVSKMRRMSKPRRKNYMRNKSCPCGSGDKFKKCCWKLYA